MALITESLLIDFLLVVSSLLYTIYWYFTRNNDYWAKRGVDSSNMSMFGLTAIGKKSTFDSVTELYEKYNKKRYVGIFQITRPMLMVLDPDLIHKVLVKDFSHFQDRGQPRFKNDPMMENLFGFKGQKWRAFRNKLTPTFTSGKLKVMFEQVTMSGGNMIQKIEQLTKEHKDVESKSFLFEFTLDVIASCAFGVQFPPNSPEFERFKSIVLQLFSFSPLRLVRFGLAAIAPGIGEYLGIKSVPQDNEDYFMNLVKTNMKFRKDNNIKRNDYFQLLLTLKQQEDSGRDMGLATVDNDEDDSVVNQMQYTGKHNQDSIHDPKLFTDEAVTANSFIFLTAGSETVSNTISFVMFELAQHLDIQQRVQQEVDSALARHGGWSYETMKDMTYLDQVIQESQRLHTLLPMLFRECVQPYKVPDSDLVIEKGVLISIPIVAIHKDPQYYTDPDRFDPDRFKDNNFKPSPTFLPFGDGPRICIAMRFAVLEVKTGLARIMSQYSVKLSEKTQLPLKLKAKSFVPTVSGGLWFNFEKRKL